MKLFKDNTTGEMLISIADKKENLLHFDGSPYIGNLDNVSDVDTGGSVSEFHRHHIVEEDFHINDDAEWHLKDVLYVPISGRTVEFRVEHISNTKVYFVAVDGVGKSTMTAMNDFLDNFLNGCPKSLVDKMCEIERKLDGRIIRKNKIMLLSRANVEVDTEDCNYDGIDGIAFDGILSEAERCKNFENSTLSYWLDTRDRVDFPNTFYSVDFRGGIEAGCDGACLKAVVPCFALPRRC